MQGAVLLPHAQAGTSVTRYAAGALAPRKTELHHVVKADIALRAGRLGPLQYGPNWETKKKRRGGGVKTTR